MIFIRMPESVLIYDDRIEEEHDNDHRDHDAKFEEKVQGRSLKKT